MSDRTKGDGSVRERLGVVVVAVAAAVETDDGHAGLQLLLRRELAAQTQGKPDCVLLVEDVRTMADKIEAAAEPPPPVVVVADGRPPAAAAARSRGSSILLAALLAPPLVLLLCNMMVISDVKLSRNGAAFEQACLLSLAYLS
jgi:hypothetical protein